jgi:DNA anti-recombination protein RmuC
MDIEFVSTQETFAEKAARKHDEYLDSLYADYKAKVDALTQEVADKFAAIPEAQEEERNKLLEYQKEKLDEMSAELSQKINQANHELLEVLESQAKKEESEEMSQLLSEMEHIDSPS